MHRTIFVLLIYFLLQFSYGGHSDVQLQFNQRLMNLENCRKINSCTVSDTVFSTDKETFQQLINLNKQGKLSTIPEDRVLCSTNTNPQKVNPINSKKIEEGKVDQAMLTADHSKSLKFYDNPQDLEAQLDSVSGYLKSYTFRKGSQKVYGNCLITLRYREETEIKSIRLNGKQMTMVTKIGIGNKIVSNFEVTNEFLVFVEQLESTTVIYELRVNSLTCQISNQTVTYTKPSKFSNIKLVNNQLIGYYDYRIYPYDRSEFLTYKSSNGVITTLQPQFYQNIFIFGFGQLYTQVWKIRYSGGQAYILGVLINSDQYIDLLNDGIQPGRVYLQFEIVYRVQNCPIGNYKDVYLYRVNMQMESNIQTISKIFRKADTYQIKDNYFTKAGQLILLTESTVFIYGDGFVTQCYLQKYNSLDLQEVYNQYLSSTLPITFGGKSGSFFFIKFENSTAYVYNTITRNFFPIRNDLQITEVYQIFDSTHFALFTPNSVLMLEFLNDQFIQKASHSIASNGSIVLQSIYIDSSTFSLLFDFINSGSSIPSIMQRGMYYLFSNKNCVTRVPTSKCSINSTSAPFGGVYKHWDLNKGDFWTAPSEQLNLFKIVKKGIDRYIYSVSDSQAQARYLDQYIQYRTLRNPPEITSRLVL